MVAKGRKDLFQNVSNHHSEHSRQLLGRNDANFHTYKGHPELDSGSHLSELICSPVAAKKNSKNPLSTLH